jgi:Protein of unknown function (DUF3025)
MPLPEALNACAPAPGAPVRFVPQSVLPVGEAYESYIFNSKQCPTREGLHDFFNGLMWHRFPRTKARLNQLQAAQIAAAGGIGQVRGPLRDALTLFDENMAFLRTPPSLWEALQAKRWAVVFGELRPLWAQSHLVLFGHALLEKLVVPRKAITAHVLLVQPGADELGDLDAWVAAKLAPEQLATKPFANLPVLGVPGWWPANEAPVFYQDPAVFRRRQ